MWKGCWKNYKIRVAMFGINGHEMTAQRGAFNFMGAMQRDNGLTLGLIF
jgi:hypothetical protein